MNVSELARKLKISSKELLEILPEVGFDIGKRAIKIDNRQAQRIVQQWPVLHAQYKEKMKPSEELIEIAESAAPKQVFIPSYISVKDFAVKLNLPLPKVMSELMKNGILSSMNEKIDFDTAAVIGQDLGFEIIEQKNDDNVDAVSEQQLASLKNEEDSKNLKPRPPVVVVMGHVDHGKTKLLDTIRQTNVVAGESGGITQHIGAYQAEKKGKLITFIDTPGHEAFTTMRSRGARIADIAILVVAADDSIQPQTKESIKIIKSAGLPMVVAINKIDKPEANIEKVKQDLAQLNLIAEDWGGKTICVPISAKAGTGIDELLDMILLVAETEQEHIKANPDRTAAGTIIESHVDQGTGPIATMVVQNGTLQIGDLVEVAGSFYGKIRAMKDHTGKSVVSAAPSMPVQIIGLKVAPSVGDILNVTTEKSKRQKINKYQLSQQAVGYTTAQETKSEEDEGGTSYNIILKADALGSLEAIIASITAINAHEVSLNIIAKGLGSISETDVERAEASGAVVYGFHVKPTQAAEHMARTKNITVKTYSIIYQLIDDVKEKMAELMKPEVIRHDQAEIKVLAVFGKDKNEKDVMVVGGAVTKGTAANSALVDVLRNGVKIAQGKIIELQTSKVKVNDVSQGRECGIKFQGKSVIEVGDILHLYTEEVKEKKVS